MFTTTESAHPIDRIQKELFIVIGGADPTDVQELVEAQLKIAERELNEVDGRAQERGQDFAEEAAPYLDALKTQLKRYLEWLIEVKSGLDNYDTGTLAAAYETSQDLVTELMEAINNYSNFFSSWGPYEAPWANALGRLALAVRHEQVDEDAWDQYLDSFAETFKQKIEIAKEHPYPGRTALTTCNEDCLAILSEMRDLDLHNEEAVESLLHKFSDAMADVMTVEYLMNEGSGGPTPAATTNVLLFAVEKALGEELEWRFAESVLDDYCDTVDKTMEDFEQSIVRPSDSALVQEEIPRTLDYSDQHYNAVEALCDALPERDTEAIRKLLGDIREAVEKLDESREVYETAAQHQTHAPCQGCGRSNPPENRVCEACGAPLARAADAGALESSTFSVLSGPAMEETQQVPMGENIAELFNACDDVAAGNITHEEFAAVLKSGRADLQEYASDLEQIADEMMDESDMNDEHKKIWHEQHLPYLQELAVQFTQGIESIGQGLESMESYLENKDDNSLIEGVRLVWEGWGINYRAQLSFESGIALLQDVLDEAEEIGLLTEQS